jgi:hypothetical protein
MFRGVGCRRVAVGVGMCTHHSLTTFDPSRAHQRKALETGPSRFLALGGCFIQAGVSLPPPCTSHCPRFRAGPGSGPIQSRRSRIRMSRSGLG